MGTGCDTVGDTPAPVFSVQLPKIAFPCAQMGPPSSSPCVTCPPLSPRQRGFILTKDVVTISLKHCTVLLKGETADFQFLTLMLTVTFLSLKRIRFNLITLCRRMAVKYMSVLISST